jgi:hypothetical protein
LLWEGPRCLEGDGTGQSKCPEELVISRLVLTIQMLADMVIGFTKVRPKFGTSESRSTPWLYCCAPLTRAVPGWKRNHRLANLAKRDVIQIPRRDFVHYHRKKVIHSLSLSVLTVCRCGFPQVGHSTPPKSARAAEPVRSDSVGLKLQEACIKESFVLTLTHVLPNVGGEIVERLELERR